MSASTENGSDLEEIRGPDHPGLIYHLEDGSNVVVRLSAGRLLVYAQVGGIVIVPRTSSSVQIRTAPPVGDGSVPEA